MGSTLEERFDRRSNALNLTRLVLAALVIVSHSWPVGGFGDDPAWGDLTLGTFAVAGFFSISGYLITASADRLSLGRFLWHRCLRIFPGLWVCLIVTAFGIAPLLATRTGGDWSASEAARYVFTNGTLRGGNTVSDELAGLPFPAAINGSLWTLKYEFLCYLALGAASLLGPLWRSRWSALVAMVALTAFGLASGSDLALLAPFFAAGVAIHRFADVLPTNPVSAVAAAGVAALAISFGYGAPLAALPLAYLMMLLGARAPRRLHRVGRTNDLSYGVYVYAFPVQQLLASVSVQDLGVGVFIGAAMLAVAPFAAASWFLVERPAMRLTQLRVGQAAARTVNG